jgi:hypothetical protein
MFKKPEKDPQKALDDAKNSLNKGLMGGLTKAFMGKEFVNEMNTAIDQGQAALNGVQQGQWLAQNGTDATALVVSVQDTGATVNMNPVLLLVLKVTTAAAVTFDITAQTMVSRIAIPRPGDTIKIKYNPANPQQLIVV